MKALSGCSSGKLKQAPPKRYLYYITPEGFAEKAKLTADYLQSSFDVFKIGRRQYESIFNTCSKNDWKHVVFLGKSELSELAMLASEKYGMIEVVHKLDDSDSIKEVTSDRKIDVVIGTHFNLKTSEAFNLINIMDDLSLNESQILIPKFLL